MHELGVVFTVIKNVEKIAVAHHAKEIGRVTLQIGEVSGIIHKYLEDVWKWAVKNRSTYMKECELVIETIKAVTLCEDCNQEYSTVEHGKICPYCKSEHTYLVKGNEFIIKDIAVKE